MSRPPPPGRKRRYRRLLLLALGLVVVVVVVLFVITPTLPPPEQPAPPPVAERPKPPLQADAEGSYVPGYAFTVNRYRFTGFSLRPDALVTFAQATGGPEQPVPCLDARISADAVHLRCEDPEIGTVTIDGTFMTRLVTKRLDASVVSAVVTVRTGSGDIVYRARDRFEWHPSDSSGTAR